MHREDDHPEDRLHQDDGVLVAGIMGHGEAGRLRPAPAPAAVLVRRSRADGDDLTWLFIGDADHVDRSITLSVETAVAAFSHLW